MSNITTYIRDYNTVLHESALRACLPETDKDIRMEGSRLVIERPIHSDMLMEAAHDEQLQQLIQENWLDMYRAMTTHVARLMIGHNDVWYVLKFTPKFENRMDVTMPFIKYRMLLLGDVHIASTHRVVVPEYVYTPDRYSCTIKEWRCGYCQRPNPIEHRECEKCGAPRTLLLHELGR